MVCQRELLVGLSSRVGSQYLDPRSASGVLVDAASQAGKANGWYPTLMKSQKNLVPEQSATAAFQLRKCL